MFITSVLGSSDSVLGQAYGAGDQDDPSSTPGKCLLCHCLSQPPGIEELGHSLLCLRLGNTLLL